MKLTLTFLSSLFSTYPNNQDKNVSISKMTRAFFITFKGLSLKQKNNYYEMWESDSKIQQGLRVFCYNSYFVALISRKIIYGKYIPVSFMFEFLFGRNSLWFTLHGNRFAISVNHIVIAYRTVTSLIYVLTLWALRNRNLDICWHK